MSNTKDIYMAYLLDEKGKASTDKSYFNKTLNDTMSLKLLSKVTNSNDDIAQIKHASFIDSVHKIKIDSITIGYARIILNSKMLFVYFTCHYHRSTFCVALHPFHDGKSQ